MDPKEDKEQHVAEASNQVTGKEQPRVTNANTNIGHRKSITFAATNTEIDTNGGIEHRVQLPSHSLPKTPDDDDEEESDDVNPTVPQETVSSTPRAPLAKSPINSSKVRPPFQRRIEPITDENEKKKFEELRAAVLSVSTYAGHVCENIDKFFKYNKNNIVRPMLKVDEIESKKARTWVFFLILLQFVVCAVFLGAIIWLQRAGLPYASYFFAGSLGIYFVLRLFSVFIFILRRGTKNSSCCAGAYTPNNEQYEEVFICIPAYNEGKEAFMNTISSIAASNYPKHRMYMFFIVDGNKANSFENLMECLTKNTFDEPVPSHHRILKHGVYEGIPYSVFLKEENRGKRDSQWLFVELLRNMIPEFAPQYVFVSTVLYYFITLTLTLNYLFLVVC
jgi:hypothetical protein